MNPSVAPIAEPHPSAAVPQPEPKVARAASYYFRSAFGFGLLGAVSGFFSLLYAIDPAPHDEAYGFMVFVFSFWPIACLTACILRVRQGRQALNRDENRPS